MAQHTETKKAGTMTENEQFEFSGPRIYIGPNAVKQGLRFGMVFKNGVPAEIKEFCAGCPQLVDLIVAPAEFAEKRKELTVKGTLINQALAAVEKYLSRGGSE